MTYRSLVNFKKITLFLIMIVIFLSLIGCPTEQTPDNPPQPTYEPQLPQYLSAIKNETNIDVTFDAVKLEENNPGYKESYIVWFSQPLDHTADNTNYFWQKSVVHFRGFDRPTVLYTCGYEMHDNYIYKPNNDIAYNLDANFVVVEHRYFGQSSVEFQNDPTYRYLTIRQHSADLHNIFTAFKKFLPNKWISTGTSKDGETSLFYRYCYPNDIDVTTSFCSPLLTDLTDDRVGKYMSNEGGTDDERTAMDTMIRRYLQNGENGIYKDFLSKYNEYNQNKQEPIVINTDYSSYVFNAFELWFDKFSYSDKEKKSEFIDEVNKASDDRLSEILLNKAIEDYSSAMPTQESPKPNFYYIQTAKELGQYIYDFNKYEDLLEGTSFDKQGYMDNPSSLDENLLYLYKEYDNSVIMDILDNFLPNTDKPILMVYSQSDPWTGARPTIIHSPNVKVIINPDGIHNHDINNEKHYAQAVKQEIMDFITEYAGLPKSRSMNDGGRGSVSYTGEINDRFMIR